MNSNENKKAIQEAYDMGVFSGLSYDPNSNVIGLSIKNGKHWDTKQLPSELPKKEFDELLIFVSELGKPKKAVKVSEEN